MAFSVRQNILTAGIAILMVFFVSYGIGSFYPAPEYSDFCTQGILGFAIESESQCQEYGGKWMNYTALQIPTLQEQYVCTRMPSDNQTEVRLSCTVAPERSGYCEVDYYCSKDFEAANEIYRRNFFVASAFLGIIVLVLGGAVLKLENVGAGIMGGGLLVILYGIVKYWGLATDMIKFLMTGIALAVLLWLGYKKLNPEKKKKGRFLR
ncbi:MAG: hypothetical protein JW727_06390 [Candidatus Aenigmarchaeota archaeon]|nr:hypothetical protein [Candidatus Aenigmarchaeota archaeon]